MAFTLAAASAAASRLLFDIGMFLSNMVDFNLLVLQDIHTFVLNTAVSYNRMLSNKVIIITFNIQHIICFGLFLFTYLYWHWKYFFMKKAETQSVSGGD